MLRCLLLAFALCGSAHASPSPRIELSVTPAWQGWTRPGRTTEVEVRLASDAATRAALSLAAGQQTVAADVDLQPGRVARLHLPVRAAERLVLDVTWPARAAERRDLGLRLSESPLLGVGLATGEPLQLEGFHTVAIAADDLPRTPSAYSSIDALVVDAPTLGALDQRQLGALLTHVAGCGRIVVLNADLSLRRVLEGAGGCGGRALMSASSLADARAKLKSSLAVDLPSTLAAGSSAEWARPGHGVWAGVVVAVAMYLAAAVLAMIFWSSSAALLVPPLVASFVVLVLMNTGQPASRLAVWSEGDSGASLARYQAWQHFPGLARQTTHAPIPRQLASAVQPCEPAQPMRFGFDAERSVALFAEFETRLFRQVSLCYAGSFPLSRTIAVAPRGDGLHDVTNAGTMGWPAGVLMVGGQVHDLPALGAGAHTTLAAESVRATRDAVVRAALARNRPGGTAALWALDLGGVADAPVDSQGWLLVSMPPP